MPRFIAVAVALLLSASVVQAVDMPRPDPRRHPIAGLSHPLATVASADAPSAPLSLPLAALSPACATGVSGTPATVADVVSAQGASLVALCPTDMQIPSDTFAGIVANSRLVAALTSAGYGLGSLRAATNTGDGLTFYVVIAR